MKKISFLFVFILLFNFLQCSSAEKEAGAIQIEGLTQDDKKAITSVRKFINYVRYSKKGDEIGNKAIEMIDLEYVCNDLISNDFAKLSGDQKKEFKDLIAEHIKLKAFPTALKYFEKIDLIYSKPVEKGNLIIIPTTLVYKGSDKIKFSWVVSKNSFKLVDLLNENSVSSMKENRDKQIMPYYRKKGITGLLEKLKEINSSLARQS